MREKTYKAGKLCMVAAIAVGMIAEPITADIAGISSIQTVTKVHAQSTTTEPDTTYSEPLSSDANVTARGKIGAASWYLDNQGILHIGPGQAQGVAGRINSWDLGNYFTTITPTDGSSASILPSNKYAGFGSKIKQIYIDPGFKMPAYSGYLFSSMPNLTAIYGLSKVDTSAVTDMDGIFSSNRSLKYVGNLDNWNTSNVTNMNKLFQYTPLTNIGDLSNWDTSNVTDMSYIFSGAPSLTNIGNLSQWNTSKVTNMDSMFYNSSSLTNIGDLSQWNTSNVTNMNFMFSHASSLTNVGDLSQWNTSNVTNMRGMFYGASALTNIGDLSKWDTSKVTSMNNMFSGVKNLSELNLSNWTVSSRTNTDDMFDDMTSLKKITFGPNWTVPVSVPNAVNGSTVWQGTTDPNNEFLATYKSSPVDVTGATNNADTYVLGPLVAKGTFGTASWYLDNQGILHIGPGQAQGVHGRIDSYSTGNYFTATTNYDSSNIVLPNNKYKGFSNNIKQIYIDPGFKMPAYSECLFSKMINLTAIHGLSKVDTSAVTDMRGIFSDDQSLTDLGNLDNWDTSNVTSMDWMFMDSPLLTNIGDLSKWDTSKVTSMDGMFDGEEKISELNLSNWTVSPRTNTEDMFTRMTSLKKITFGPNWTAWVTVPNAVNGSTVWQGTTDPNNEFLATYKSSPVDVTGATNNADTYVLGPPVPAQPTTTQPTQPTTTGPTTTQPTQPTTTDSEPPSSDANVTAKGTFGTASWYLDNQGILHIGPGQAQGVHGRIDSSSTGNYFTATTNDDSSNIVLPNKKYEGFRNKIKQIYIDPGFKMPAYSENLFSEMPNLTAIHGLSKVDTSAVTNMISMFSDDQSLTDLGNLDNWDTSNVTDMSFMFMDSPLLTNIGDLSKWDTSKVTSMDGMFDGEENLSELNLSNWTVSRRTQTEDMFTRMTSLKKITFGPNWTAWVTVPNAVNGSSVWQGTTDPNNKFLAYYKFTTPDVTGATTNADTYVLGPPVKTELAKTEIVTTDTLSGSAQVGDNQTGPISQTGKLSFTVAGGDKGTITMALAKESSNVITGLHLASVKDDLEGTAKDYDITAGASTQIGTYSINGTHNYSIDPSKSNIKLNSTFAKPGTYTAATTYTMNNTPNA